MYLPSTAASADSPAQQAAVAPAPAEAEVAASAAASSSDAAPADALSSFLAKGDTMTAYTWQKKKKRLATRQLTLWIANDEDGAATLYWGGSDEAHVAARQPQPEGDHELTLSDITSVEVGKGSSAVLKRLEGDASVADACCVAISSEATKLDLVAESAERAKAIVDAINQKRAADKQ